MPDESTGKYYNLTQPRRCIFDTYLSRAVIYVNNKEVVRVNLTESQCAELDKLVTTFADALRSTQDNLR